MLRRNNLLHFRNITLKSRQQVLSYKYQYQWSKYQYKYQYLACKYKYKYQYQKTVLKYRSSTSIQYNKTAKNCVCFAWCNRHVSHLTNSLWIHNHSFQKTCQLFILVHHLFTNFRMLYHKQQWMRFTLISNSGYDPTLKTPWMTLTAVNAVDV